MNEAELLLEQVKLKQRNYRVQDIINEIEDWNFWGEEIEGAALSRTLLCDHDTVVLALEKCSLDDIADFLISVAQNQVKWRK